MRGKKEAARDGDSEHDSAHTNEGDLDGDVFVESDGGALGFDDIGLEAGAAAMSPEGVPGQEAPVWGAAPLASPTADSAPLHMPRAEPPLVVGASEASGDGATASAREGGIRRAVNPDSFDWGPAACPKAFHLTWSPPDVKPPHGQWQALCRFHRLNQTTACTKSLSAGIGKLRAKRLAMAWCLVAPVHDRKRHHGAVRPQMLEPLDEEVLDARMALMEPPPLAVPTDTELDQAEFELGGDAEHGGAQDHPAAKPGAKRKAAHTATGKAGTPKAKAEAKPRARAASSNAGSRSSSSDSSSSSAASSSSTSESSSPSDSS